MLHNEQIAAISVFGVYKTENRDAYDVIADFTKAAIAIKKEVEITPEVVQSKLMELYSLNIPVSIIKGVLKNRLKEIVSRTNGVYIVNSLPQDDISSKIDELLESGELSEEEFKQFIKVSTRYSVVVKKKEEVAEVEVTEIAASKRPVGLKKFIKGKK